MGAINIPLLHNSLVKLFFVSTIPAGSPGVLLLLVLNLASQQRSVKAEAFNLPSCVQADASLFIVYIYL